MDRDFTGVFYCFLLSLQVKDPSEAMKTPGGLSKGFDPVT